MKPYENLLLRAEYTLKNRIISTKIPQETTKISDKFCDKNDENRHIITKTYKRAYKHPTNTDKQPTKNYALNVLKL